MCADAASTQVDICRIQATARRFGTATRRAPFAKPQPRRILFTKIANFPHLRKFFPRKISNPHPINCVGQKYSHNDISKMLYRDNAQLAVSIANCR